MYLKRKRQGFGPSLHQPRPRVRPHHRAISGVHPAQQASAHSHADRHCLVNEVHRPGQALQQVEAADHTLHTSIINIIRPIPTGCAIWGYLQRIHSSVLRSRPGNVPWVDWNATIGDLQRPAKAIVKTCPPLWAMVSARYNALSCRSLPPGREYSGTRTTSGTSDRSPSRLKDAPRAGFAGRAFAPDEARVAIREPESRP